MQSPTVWAHFKEKKSNLPESFKAKRCRDKLFLGKGSRAHIPASFLDMGLTTMFEKSAGSKTLTLTLTPLRSNHNVRRIEIIL